MSTEVLGYKHADIMIISKVKRSRRRRRQREAKRMDDMFHREDDHHVFVMLIHFPVFLKDLYLTNFLLFSRERWINLYLLSLHAMHSNLLRFHLHNLGSIIIQILAIRITCINCKTNKHIAISFSNFYTVVTFVRYSSCTTYNILMLRIELISCLIIKVMCFRFPS